MSSKFSIIAWYKNLAVREKRIFQAAMAVILLLLLDWTVITPLWDYYVSTEERINASEKILVRNLVNLQRKEVVEAEYEKYRPFIRPAGSDEEENASLLSELERLARENQVVLVDMKPREVKAGEFRREFVAELDAEAEMPNLLGFIHNMEASTQLMKVSNVKFIAKESTSTVIKARITITKMVFLGAS